MNMEDKIKAVKEKLSCIDTEELLGIISLHFTTFANANGEIQENLPFQFTSELMSPQKQYFYLAGLLMSTQYKGNGKENNELLLSLEKDIQEITQDYSKKKKKKNSNKILCQWMHSCPILIREC